MSISAMKQALEALALVASSDEWLGCQTYEGQIATSAHEALSQAIAEAEKQEPVAFRNTETGEFCTGGFLRKDLAKWQPVYTTPVACDDDIYDIWVEQKPVHANDISQECVDETAKGEHEFECPRCGHCCREWVGLTHEERDDIDQAYQSRMQALFAIEAKLKEKNT